MRRALLIAAAFSCSAACEFFCPSGCLGGRSGDPAKGVDVFCSGEDGYCSYNIPSVLRTGKGTLLAFVEARHDSCIYDQGYVDLKLKRSTDGGRTWSKASLVWGESGNGAKHTIGDHQPIWDSNLGVVHVVFTRDNHDVFYVKSTDEGLTWQTPPRNISSMVHGHRDPGWIFTGHANGLQTSTGRLIVMLHGPCRTIYSDDHGETWKEGGATDGGECQATEVRPGLLALTARNNSKNYPAFAYIGWSTDDGLTWSTSPNEDLRSPTIQGGVEGSIVAHPNGRLYHSQPDHALARRNMVVKVSSDDGHTWGNQAHVWSSGAGYSSIIVAGNSTGHIGEDSPLGLLYVRTDSIISRAAFLPKAATFISIPTTSEQGDLVV